MGAFALTVTLVVRARVRWPRWAALVPAYAIGAIAMFWVLQRVTAFANLR